MSIVAIDFGTSNTMIAVMDPVTQAPRILSFTPLSRRLEGEIHVVPSVVVVQPDGSLVMGEPVRAQRLGIAHPDRYFHSFKRELVADYRSPSRQFNAVTYTPEVVSGLFLQELWQQVCQQLDPTHVIFTLPVGSFEHYREWFQDTAHQLGMPSIQLVDESTAAALGYAVQQLGDLVLVVDFGGGTLDISLVRTAHSHRDQTILQAEVVAKSDAYVGGVDIDRWIVEEYLRRNNLASEQIGAMGWQTLLDVAERLKIRLSTEPEATEQWFDDETFMAYEIHLTQVELANLLDDRQLLEQLRQALDEVLAIALHKGITKPDVKHVLLVGGSCQIPAVQNLLVSYFGKQRVKLDKPFAAVVEGALVLAQLQELQDELRHGYAIRLWEPYSRSYSYRPLFAKGTRYPCQQDTPLILQVASDGQNAIRLDIGEVADLTQTEVTFDDQGRMTSSYLIQQEAFRSLSIGEDLACVANLNPPGEQGIDRIEARFEVNAQRMLLVTVKDLLTGDLLIEKTAIAKLR